jgi:prepilin-type N-terminal cleavage/methylation domain-containing protein
MKRNTMKYCTLYGFTLIELIVVILIIVMLLGVLIPAIPYARESECRTTCLNNQAQIALGIINYEGSHGVYPGWRQTLANGREVSWMVMLLPYLEYNKVWKILSAESFNEKEITSLSDLHISMSICPTSTNFKETQMSYIVNCGKMDAEFAAISPIIQPDTLPTTNPKTAFFLIMLKRKRK